MTDLELFHVEGALATRDPYAGLSPDARRTARQKAMVANGVHPLRGDKAHPEKGTCGDCVHRLARQFPKCALGPRTHGAATDVRAWWPACGRHEPKEPT